MVLLFYQQSCAQRSDRGEKQSLPESSFFGNSANVVEEETSWSYCLTSNHLPNTGDEQVGLPTKDPLEVIVGQQSF